MALLIKWPCRLHLSPRRVENRELFYRNVNIASLTIACASRGASKTHLQAGVIKFASHLNYQLEKKEKRVSRATNPHMFAQPVCVCVCLQMQKSQD